MLKMAILTEINRVDNIQELEDIGKHVYNKIKNMKQMTADKISWYVGQKVRLKAKFAGRKPYNAVGTVDKANPKKLKVNYGDLSLWNIPKTMLEVVE